MARILLVSHEMSVTGAPNSLLRQAGHFRSAGHDVDVWTHRGGPLAARYEEAGFSPVVVEDSRRAVKSAFESSGRAYDLVVCNTIRTYRAADMLQRYGVPVVWFVRETGLLDEDWWMNPDFARVFRDFYNVYTVSEYNAEVVRAYNPRVRVVRNAVADRFRRFAEPADRVRFGFIGSYIAMKGVDLLLEAFAEVRKALPAAELLLAGKPWTEWGLALKAAHADDPGVRWVGEVQGADKDAFFDSIDALCVPSLDEPSGLTVLEGAMYGKAVVTTDRTGAKYAVNPSCGRVVEAGSAAALARALAELGDPASVAAMGRRARESYLACGTTELERAAVLKMLGDNVGRAPVVKSRPGSDATPFFHEVRSMTGRRRFYLGPFKVFSVRGEGVRRRK